MTNRRRCDWFSVVLIVVICFLSGCTTTRTVEVPIVKYVCPAIPTTPAPDDETLKLKPGASVDQALRACDATINNYAAALKSCDSTIEAVNKASK